MHRLQVDPELGSGVERLRKEPCGLGRHPPLATNDFVDALERNSEVPRKAHLRDAQRTEGGVAFVL